MEVNDSIGCVCYWVALQPMDHPSNANICYIVEFKWTPGGINSFN